MDIYILVKKLFTHTKTFKMNTQRKISKKLIDDIGKNSYVELETCGNLLVQNQNQYDQLFLDHSALLLEKEQLIIDNKRLLHDDAIHLSVRKDLEQKIQDDIATIRTLWECNSQLKERISQEKDFFDLRFGQIETYATKLSDRNSTYRKIIWLLLCTNFVFGIGFFLFLINYLG